AFLLKPSLEESGPFMRPALFFGEVGSAVSGLPAGISEAPGLDGSSLVSLKAITRGAGDAPGNNGLLSQASASNGHLTAIGGTGHHCCSHAYIGESPLPGSPAITIGGSYWETISAPENFRSLQDFGSLTANFDSLADNPFDSSFPATTHASLVLAGAGDDGMSGGVGISAGGPA